MREALTLGSYSIETEHILLGISRESVAMRILIELDAELPSAEGEVRQDQELGLEIRNAIVRDLSNRPFPTMCRWSVWTDTAPARTLGLVRIVAEPVVSTRLPLRPQGGLKRKPTVAYTPGAEAAHLVRGAGLV